MEDAREKIKEINQSISLEELNDRINANKSKEKKIGKTLKSILLYPVKFWGSIFGITPKSLVSGSSRSGSMGYGGGRPEPGFRETYRVEPRRISHEDLQRRLTEFRDVEKVTDGKGDPPAPCDCKHER